MSEWAAFSARDRDPDRLPTKKRDAGQATHGIQQRTPNASDREGGRTYWLYCMLSSFGRKHRNSSTYLTWRPKPPHSDRLVGSCPFPCPAPKRRGVSLPYYTTGYGSLASRSARKKIEWVLLLTGCGQAVYNYMQGRCGALEWSENLRESVTVMPPKGALCG